MKCKFCGNDKPLIKAHVIPAGFFRRLRKGQNALEYITNKAGEYNRRSPIGVYDGTIVCNECESIWRDWDDYAQKLLAEEPLNAQARFHDGQKIAYIVRDFDYKKLKLFFISMIWRASVSSHQFFSKVSLGHFEDIAKQHIANGDPGDNQDFSTVLAKFDHPSAKPILDPHEDSFSGVHYYRFYLASYIAYIKVDHSPAPMWLSPFAMTEKTPLCIVCRDFTKSKELNLMEKLVGS